MPRYRQNGFQKPDFEHFGGLGASLSGLLVLDAEALLEGAGRHPHGALLVSEKDFLSLY